MGALLSIPLAGGLATIGSSCLAGLAFCFTSTAGAFTTIFLFLAMHKLKVADFNSIK